MKSPLLKIRCLRQKVSLLTKFSASNGESVKSVPLRVNLTVSILLRLGKKSDSNIDCVCSGRIRDTVIGPSSFTHVSSC